MGTFSINRLANKSAAELLGAAATILARVLLFQICLIASVMVTVFPVPGGPKIIYGIPGIPPVKKIYEKKFRQINNFTFFSQIIK